MAIFTTADGRQIVGAAQAGNEYKGYAGRREIVIQLTATGATQDSLDALEFLKSYALYHNSVGEPIFPASTNVFISNNGVTKAVEADEVTVDGANVNIGGCVWNGTAWDFTNAGQSGGGGSSGGGVLMVNATESDDAIICDKTAGEMLSAYKSGTTVIIKAASEGMATYQNVMWVEEYDNDETSFHTLSDTYEALTLDDYPSYSNAN
jgi:hypothetical protein